MAVEKNDVNPGATPEGCVELLSSHEVARRLGISPQYARKLLRKRQLPGFQIGKKWLVPKPNLETYIAGLYKSIHHSST